MKQTASIVINKNDFCFYRKCYGRAVVPWGNLCVSVSWLRGHIWERSAFLLRTLKEKFFPLVLQETKIKVVWFFFLISRTIPLPSNEPWRRTWLSVAFMGLLYWLGPQKPPCCTNTLSIHTLPVRWRCLWVTADRLESPHKVKRVWQPVCSRRASKTFQQCGCSHH